MGPQDVGVIEEIPIVESVEIKEIARLLKENEDLRLEIAVKNAPVVDQSMVNELSNLRETVMFLQDQLKTAENDAKLTTRLREELAHKAGQIQAYIDVVESMNRKFVEAIQRGY